MRPFAPGRRPDRHADRRRAIGATIVFALGLALDGSFADRARGSDAPTADAIRGMLGGSSESIDVGGARVDAVLARALYGPRADTPIWVDGSPARVNVLAQTLRDAGREGLDAADYHVAQIDGRLGSSDAPSRAELDVLLSDALMRYGVHVRRGAYRPTRTTADAALERDDPDPVALVLAAASSADLPAFLAALPPPHAPYRAMRDSLARYRAIDAAGGWGTVPDGPKLEPGRSDPRVPALRARLLASGDLDSAAGPGDLYSPELVTALRTFQARHGLAPDGTIGPRTREALNTSAAERVRQIEIALERLRWLPDDLGERYVTINVPDYRLRLAEHGTTVLEMPVVVGKPSWPTPIFSTRIEDVVFNPPWNIPPRIAREELLPKAGGSVGYFTRQGISVRGAVREVSVSDVPEDGDDDEAAAGAPRSKLVIVGPVRLKQAPGPKNPLGRVKFQMPNPFHVYLHDTPNKSAFKNTSRALSHGCVRLGNPKALAAAVFAADPEWSEDRRDKVWSGWGTRYVNVKDPLPVHIVYWTAWHDDRGELQFSPDVYKRDAEMARDWGRPRGVRPPPPPAPAVIEPEDDDRGEEGVPAVAPAAAPVEASSDPGRGSVSRGADEGTVIAAPAQVSSSKN